MKSIGEFKNEDDVVTKKIYDPINIQSGVDLNSLRETGIYHKSLGWVRKEHPNAPLVGRPFVIKVLRTKRFILQEYLDWENRYYTRTCNLWGGTGFDPDQVSWTPWKEH